MQPERQRAAAAWAVLVVPFPVVAWFLAGRGDLTPLVVALYWFPAVALTLVGAFPSPRAAAGALRSAVA
ncbi:hypothetical protein [Halosegnis marinus]|uniref:Uncharacterized protein n=1 Tax=Halosegnis marinus TaxID=3034023 RepID=A0ABD5ZNE4_9EURY|nr:hypothetical protein [Halosegnis sp. DT85]